MVLDFVNHKLQVLKDGVRGYGVFAIAQIHKGETLAIYGGGFVDQAHLKMIPEHIRPFFYQVAPGIWSGHGLDEHGVGIAEKINHSCQPNSGFKSIAEVVAIKDIEKGEAITLDYAAFQSEELEGSTFDCACGSPNCRKQVTIDDWKLIDPSSIQFQGIQPYLQAKISNASSQSAKIFSKLIFPAAWKSPITDGKLSSALLSDAVILEASGARAAKDIRKNEIVCLLAGKVIPYEALSSINQNIHRYYRHISENYLIGPKDSADTASIKALHQGLEPNLEFCLEFIVVANRDIKAGKPLSLDSSTFIRGPYSSSNSPRSSEASLTAANYTNENMALNLKLNEPEYRPNIVEAANADRLHPHPNTKFNKHTHLTVRTKSVVYQSCNVTYSFFKSAITEDWSAAPIAFVGSIIATYITALTVANLAPAFEWLFGSSQHTGYILGTSTLAVVLGYGSYCFFYWSGMLLKERKDMLDENGKFSKELFLEKWRILKWDFLMHLPSDGYWVFGMFTVQGGLYATGTTNLFWSIFLSQAISDVYYSLREPFYWRAAKTAARWSANRKIAKLPANNDTLEDHNQKQAANS